MNDRSLQAAALGLALFTCFTADHASAYCRMTTEGGAQIGGALCVEKGEPLFWESGCLSYAIDEGGSDWMPFSDVEAAINASFATWESANCSSGTPNLVFEPSIEPSTCQRAEFNTTGNVNTIAFLNPWKDPCADEGTGYDPFAFAVTIVWVNTTTGEILDADMMINDLERSVDNAGGPYTNCPPEGCPPGNPGPADLASIVTHEAGHFIGIGHSDVLEATMFPSVKPESVENRTLAQDDIKAVCDIYPPGNLSPETCNPIPEGGLQLNCETTASGDPIACDSAPGAPSSSSGGCSATQTPADAPWAPLLAALAGLIALRRRSARRTAN